MSRKAWIAIGVGAGALVLYELFKSGGVVARSSAPRTQVSTTGAVISGLASVIPSIVTSFSSPSGPQGVGPTTWGGGATPVLPIYGQGYSYGGETLNAGSAADNAQISLGSED